MTYLHFIKKNFWILLFFIFSCGGNFDKLKEQKSFQAIYEELKDKNSLYPNDRRESAYQHSLFLKACQDDKNFYSFISANVEKKDIPYCTDLRNFVKSVFNQKACCYIPNTPAEQVQDVYQICLVPGFFIRTVDVYTPMIAQAIVNFLCSIYANCVAITDILARWDGFRKDHDDNTDFATQCEVMNRQITEKKDNLKKEYPNAKIHLIFVCESYGGKIALFYLNKFLNNLQDDRISVDRFITVHSPLFGMVLAQYVVNNKDMLMELYTNQAFALLLSYIQFDFLGVLNVEHYWNTFDLLSKDQIEGVTTDQALQNLIDHKVKILNFIGTPNEVVLGGNEINYNVIIKILNIIKSWFFIKNTNGEEVFMENKWDTFDHTLSTLSEIVFELKDKNSFQTFGDNLNQQWKTAFSNITKCSTSDEVKKILLQTITPVFTEQMFLDLALADCFTRAAGLLRDITYMFDKYVHDSDMVVKVDEITKNPELLKLIQNSRNKSFTFYDTKQSFIVSSDIFHVGYHRPHQFEKTLNQHFIQYLKSTC